VSALALHLVQAAIAYLNTQMIQIVLRDPKWRKKLTGADWRGLSALFWTCRSQAICRKRAVRSRLAGTPWWFLEWDVSEPGPPATTPTL
jgi:hypothetical protein